MLLEVKLLGRPEALLGGRAVALGGKPMTLLYLIAAHPDGLPRQQAWSLLWGDDGAQSLRQALVALRRLEGAQDWLEDGEVLRLHGAVDLVAFEDAVSERRYAQALSLHRGVLFEGVQVRATTDFQDWLGVERVRLEQLLLEALRGRASELEDGQPLEALALVERWQILDPLSEEALRMALRLEIRDGQRPAALRRFHAFRRMLRDELGADVLPETLEIVGLNDAPASPRSVPLSTTALRLVRAQRLAPELSVDAAFWADVLELEAFTVAEGLAELEAVRDDLSVPDTPPSLRVLLHQRIAVALESRLSTSDGAGVHEAQARVALHWQRAQHPGLAMQWWFKAAASAQRERAFDAALQLSYRALWLSGDDANRRDALVSLSHIADARNDLELLRVTAAELLRLGEVIQDDLTLFHGHLRRSGAHLRSGNAANALEDGQEALGIARRLEQPEFAAQAQGTLGTAHLAGGQLEAARAAFELAATSSDATLQLRANANLGSIAGMTGNLEGALAHFDAALTVARATQNFAVTGAILFNLGATAEKLHRFNRAETGFREAISVAQRLGNAALLLQGTLALAKVHAARGHWGAAFNTACEALELAQGSPLQPQAQYLLGELEARFGRFEAAEALYSKALEGFRTAGNARLAMSVEVSQALLSLQRRDEAADERVRLNLEVLRDAGHVDQFDHARLEYALLTNDPAALRWAIEGLPESLVSVCVAIARLARLEGRALDVANLEATLETALAAENFAELPLGYDLLADEFEARDDTDGAARMHERARSVNLERAAGLPKLQRMAFLQLEV
jgi:DNA-binding SARP family transcriptional activator/predicted negative regulator of RcsB-dependent stress response